MWAQWLSKFNKMIYYYREADKWVLGVSLTIQPTVMDNVLF